VVLVAFSLPSQSAMTDLDARQVQGILTRLRRLHEAQVRAAEARDLEELRTLRKDLRALHERCSRLSGATLLARI
jgi:hypothetical protein